MPKLYRYESTPPYLYLYEYEVVKKTPKGFWIDAGYPKFVLENATKRFAHTNIEDAYISYVKRKLRRKFYLERDLAICEQQLKLNPVHNKPVIISF